MTLRPGRTVVTAGILLAVIAAALTACTNRPAPNQTAPATATTTTAGTHPSVDADDGDDSDDGAQPDTAAAPDPAALDVIAAFATAWARPDLDQQHWYTGVAGLAAPAYAARLATVDPAMVPATRITGPPTVTSATTASVVANVGTDAGPITITCVRYDGRWLVTDVQPPEHPTGATP
ncbi:hypothetical protein [Dactylosporangium sp. NPDC048998]|uniref:hypothetical protein n=1 Tax=Dactylosporangium sp. NPDC048998 TaxID=3363976 RepID=UPI0037122302